ncbi:hypothetical protein [Azospirillum sp. SYSU D00513]|uniref:hypothetical protein n=1 Tax=Azospirillum sp. SYSU D00513 TaxID=2812561 RepID=UPI001A97CD2C|nr:hypothetical protein [Azospirillum sp. SYSU D00513]
MRPERNDIGNHCRKAFEILERLAEDNPGKRDAPAVYEDMVEVIRCLVRMRDGLAEELRSGRAGGESQRRLDCVNTTLSIAFGGEYPVVGIHMERVRTARDLMRGLLETAN